MKRLIIYPINGFGERFKVRGYNQPKPLINISGEPLIFRSISSLKLGPDDIIHIIYPKYFDKFQITTRLVKRFPDISFSFESFPFETKGAAETVALGLSKIGPDYSDLPILILDGDNIYNDSLIENWAGRSCVFYFSDLSKDNKFSYIEILDGLVSRIKEKEKISDNACLGAYGFSSLKLFCENFHKRKGEYLSHVIAASILGGERFVAINDEDFSCFGTPHQLLNNFELKEGEKKRFCFDLDGTLVTFPLNRDYLSVLPIEDNINYLRFLKDCGHEIIIYTARGMKSSGGDIGKINKKNLPIILETLQKFEIPYDEIYLGKPYADFYIDDLAVNANGDLERETGFYKKNIEPRSFNKIAFQEETVSKVGQVEGEIFYYNNLPESLKEIFPRLISSSDSLVLEHIKGVTFSRLLVDDLLNIYDLSQLLDYTSRIHDHSTSTIVNIHDNLSLKVKQRFKEFDYSKFADSERVYNELLSLLEIYEKKEKEAVIIHGDLVFSNIIRSNDSLKLIDPRGKIGNTLTIYGDSYYDYAKIYQSLRGYDFILNNKRCSSSSLISFFEKELQKKNIDLNDIKLITASLFFSLIPLHDNNKCNSYYQLAVSLLNEVKAPKDKKRVALCISGEYRNFSHTYSNILENLSKDGVEIDLFAYFWRKEDMDLKPMEKFNLRGISIIDQQLFPELSNYKTGFDQIPFNTISMYYAMKKCNELKLQYEESQGFKYDHVVRMRSDFWFFSPVNYNDLVEEACYVICPWGDIGWNDYIAAGPSDIIDKYCKTFDYIKEFMDDPNKPVPNNAPHPPPYGEMLCKYGLDKQGVKVIVGKLTGKMTWSTHHGIDL